MHSGPTPSNEHSASSEERKEVSNEWPSGRLFIGVIGINKWEEDTQSLYNKLLNEGNNFRTDFWGKLITWMLKEA